MGWYGFSPLFLGCLRRCSKFSRSSRSIYPACNCQRPRLFRTHRGRVLRRLSPARRSVPPATSSWVTRRRDRVRGRGSFSSILTRLPGGHRNRAPRFRPSNCDEFSRCRTSHPMAIEYRHLGRLSTCRSVRRSGFRVSLRRCRLCLSLQGLLQSYLTLLCVWSPVCSNRQSRRVLLFTTTLRQRPLALQRRCGYCHCPDIRHPARIIPLSPYRLGRGGRPPATLHPVEGSRNCICPRGVPCSGISGAETSRSSDSK